jgi:cytochrome c-type biogenesis protein CcmH
MLFWPIFALMTGAAVFAVLWPLGRARIATAAGEADLAVYRDQLGEIERDHLRGIIGVAEAEAARVEVSRRLIGAGDRAADAIAPGAERRRRMAAIIALAGIPLIAFVLYGFVGSPGLPDAPLQARLAKPPEQQDVSILVRRIETHLAANPGDARGWEVLAPIYLRLGRADEAVNARTKVLQLLGPSAAREADLGEALTAAAGGVVNTEARAAFERALALDPENAKAKIFLEFAGKQQGHRGRAKEIA